MCDRACYRRDCVCACATVLVCTIVRASVLTRPAAHILSFSSSCVALGSESRVARDRATRDRARGSELFGWLGSARAWLATARGSQSRATPLCCHPAGYLGLVVCVAHGRCRARFALRPARLGAEALAFPVALAACSSRHAIALLFSSSAAISLSFDAAAGAVLCSARSVLSLCSLRVAAAPIFEWSCEQ